MSDWAWMRSEYGPYQSWVELYKPKVMAHMVS